MTTVWLVGGYKSDDECNVWRDPSIYATLEKAVAYVEYMGGVKERDDIAIIYNIPGTDYKYQIAERTLF